MPVTRSAHRDPQPLAPRVVNTTTTRHANGAKVAAASPHRRETRRDLADITTSCSRPPSRPPSRTRSQASTADARPTPPAVPVSRGPGSLRHMDTPCHADVCTPHPSPREDPGVYASTTTTKTVPKSKKKSRKAHRNAEDDVEAEERRKKRKRKSSKKEHKETEPADCEGSIPVTTSSSASSRGALLAPPCEPVMAPLPPPLPPSPGSSRHEPITPLSAVTRPAPHDVQDACDDIRHVDVEREDARTVLMPAFPSTVTLILSLCLVDSGDDDDDKSALRQSAREEVDEIHVPVVHVCQTKLGAVLTRLDAYMAGFFSSRTPGWFSHGCPQQAQTTTGTPPTQPLLFFFPEDNAAILNWVRDGVRHNEWTALSADATLSELLVTSALGNPVCGGGSAAAFARVGASCAAHAPSQPVEVVLRWYEDQFELLDGSLTCSTSRASVRDDEGTEEEAPGPCGAHSPARRHGLDISLGGSRNTVHSAERPILAPPVDVLAMLPDETDDVRRLDEAWLSPAVAVYKGSDVLSHDESIEIEVEVDELERDADSDMNGQGAGYYSW